MTSVIVGISSFGWITERYGPGTGLLGIGIVMFATALVALRMSRTCALVQGRPIRERRHPLERSVLHPRVFVVGRQSRGVLKHGETFAVFDRYGTSTRSCGAHKASIMRARVLFPSLSSRSEHTGPFSSAPR